MTQVYARVTLLSKNQDGEKHIFCFVSLSEKADMKLKVRLFCDIKPEAPKYRRRKTQQKQLCVRRIATKLQQLNCERRRNSFGRASISARTKETLGPVHELQSSATDAYSFVRPRSVEFL